MIFKRVQLAAAVCSAFFCAAVQADYSTIEHQYTLTNSDAVWLNPNVSSNVHVHLTVLGPEGMNGDVYPVVLMPRLNFTESGSLSITLNGRFTYDPRLMHQFGAGLAVGEGVDEPIHVDASGGSMIYWAGHDAYDDDYVRQTWDAMAADSQARMYLERKGHRPKDTLLLERPLSLTTGHRIAVGATDADKTAAGNYNLLIGSNGALVIDLALTRDGPVPIVAGEGTRLYFAKNSSVLVEDFQGSQYLRSNTSTFPASISHTLISLAENAEVIGLENLTVVVLSGSVPTEYWLMQDGDGNWRTGGVVWEAEGRLAPIVNALAQKVFTGQSSEPLRMYFRANPTSEGFANRVLHSTLMPKSLGTTESMSSMMLEGARHAVRSATASEWSNPVSVDILTLKRRGRFVTAGPSYDTYTNGRWERDADGIALSADLRYGDFFGGLRAAYEDADVELSGQELVMQSNTTAESTVLSVAAWVGGMTNWGYWTADAAFAGAEDKLREVVPGSLADYTLWVGSERIRRRAYSLGGTAVMLPWPESVWTPSLTGGLSAQYFTDTDYSVDGNGVALWQVKEDKRLIWTTTVSMGVSRRWADEEGKNTVRLSLEAGVRARFGDLDVEQELQVGSVSDRVTTDDLSRGEAFLSADLTGRWKGSVFGIRASGMTGPDDGRAYRADFHVTYEF